MSVRAFVAGAILQTLTQAAHAAAPPIHLPTPCVGGACGTNTKNTPFVTSGQASAVFSGQSLTVNQASNQAILNWQNFKIDPGYSVTFNQPSNTAAALNRIWSADPSVISGQLKANGQVYLLNQNGIVFANGAQVNVGGLTASTLDVSDTVFLKGLLSGNTANLTTGGILPPVFTSGSTPPGAVTVQAGAELQTSDGGRIMLLGSTVTNAGKISTPDGQTILGAGTQVYLASTTDPSLRGLLIAVDSQEVAANSTVTNTGKIQADRGNITLAGLVVNQAGTVSATTSVNANGSIYLVAGDADQNVFSFYSTSKTGFNQGQLLPTVGGSVTLAPGSVTEVQPDTTSTTTITSAQTFYPSQVSLVGKTVQMQGNASIVAPGGQVTVAAFDNPFKGVSNEGTHTASPAPDGARIYLDSGSTVDVSGLKNVSAPASENLVQIQLGANELQDDPLLRTGFLHGATVTVDVTKGSPLLNATTLKSYAATIGHGIQEVLTSAGSINLVSGGDVITRAGSKQNVSGGSIAFQNSSGATSKLIGADGKVYDIGSAPNNIQYVGFADNYSFTDPRWGTKTSYSAGGQVAGYIQGSSAGAIDILAPHLYLSGTMLASTVQGPYQRGATTLPRAGSFAIGDPNATPDSAPPHLVNFDAPTIVLVDSLPDALGAFDPGTSQLPQPDTAQIGIGDLTRNGFNQISLASNGSVTLPSSMHIEMAGGGALSIEAASVTLSGTVHSPGSAISVKTGIGLAGQQSGSPATPAPNILLDANAKLDVSGKWVNDSPIVTSQLGTAPTLYDGGSVSLVAAAEGNVSLASGSLIDVSGGGWVNSSNKLKAGSGGSIALKSGGPGLVQPNFATAGVTLNGELRGAGLKSGGSLSVTSAWLTVGAAATGAPGELSLSPAFFSQGGFRSYSMTGINGVTIGSSDPKAPVTIQPLQQNLVFTQNMLLQKTGSSLSDFTSLQTLPQEYRGPANISFASTLASLTVPNIGNITLNAGATIATDPGAAVSLVARNNMSVFGTISAPAGTINLQIAPGGPLDDQGRVATQLLLLGSTARLLAPGFAAIYTDNALAYRQGQILSGGSINVVANKGSVVATTGAVLDVSGTAGVLDLAQQGLNVVPTTVGGEAGRINIQAFADMILNATLIGKAANVPGAAGGTLSIGLDKFDLAAITGFNGNGSSLAPYPTADRNLTITSQRVLSDSLPVDASGNVIDGVATVSSSVLTSGGFDNIRLSSSNIITFDGAPALAPKSTLVLNALEFAGTPAARASLSSAYVAIGEGTYYQANTGESGVHYSPVLGDATLTVGGSLIDVVGNTTLTGFQSVAFNSSSDVRLSYAVDAADATDFTGSIKTAAGLTFKAAQIYPVTGAHFTINPTDVGDVTADPTSQASYSYTPGAVTFNPGSTSAPLPLSALGTLTVNSPEINQNGVLRAPFGQIALNGVGPQSIVAVHTGSVTSVSGSGELIPYGSTQNGRQWVYQTDDNGTAPTQALVGTLSPKQISMNGSDVVLDPKATVDLSGGGDLYGYEFIAGTEIGRAHV